MTSSASYDAVVNFLEGDSGDVLSTINAEQDSLLVSGSVVVTRAPRQNGGTRRVNAPAICVEIVPRGDAKPIGVGIGMKEVALVFDLECNVRRKDLSKGANLLNTAEDMARALMHRYDGVSSLALAGMSGLSSYFGSHFPTGYFTPGYFGADGEFVGCQFLRSTAERVEIDQDPDRAELVRAVTRVTFNFLEARATNARA